MSKKTIKSDLARIDRMKDSDIDYSDIPPLDKSFITKATEAWPVKRRPRKPGGSVSASQSHDR